MNRENLAEVSSLEIKRLCHSGLDSQCLRVELLKLLRTVIPSDYVFFSTTDPSTQLFTSSVLDPTRAWTLALFLENEFLKDDFNKFRHMLKNHRSIGLLSEQTQNDLDRSPRYREILAPMALGDEMRAIFVTNGACWGTLCLHRERSKFDYTTDEAPFLARLTPHIAEGLRKALLLDYAPLAKTPDGPGVLILTEDLSVAATTAAAEYWLRQLAEVERGDKLPLPQPVFAVVTCLLGIERGTVVGDSTPKVRLRTRTGHWLVLYASRLRSSESQGQITVIIEPAQPAEIAPLIMQAYDLTKREGDITQCVLRGWSTNEITTALHISANTVQDHLKAIFEKVDVGSRRELAARIFTQQYQPHFVGGAPLDASGRLTSLDRSSSHHRPASAQALDEMK